MSIQTCNLPKVLVIVGPTTSHKTALAIKIANTFNGEIINADAYQVYKDMIIGTNAPTKSELQQTQFHLNQFIEITEKWDIKKFQSLATQTIKNIISNNKLPIIVGGSNLYIDAILRNYDLTAPERDTKYERMDSVTLYNKLKAIDESTAIKIGVNNHKKLARALQLLSLDKNNLTNVSQPIFEFFIVECNYDSRIDLYKSINNKVDEMIKDGWISEVEKLLAKYGYDYLISSNAFKAIGYCDILNHIVKKQDLDLDKIKQNIRHYAKRQITWIRNKFKPNIRYLQNNQQEVFDEIKKWLKN